MTTANQALMPHGCAQNTARNCLLRAAVMLFGALAVSTTWAANRLETVRFDPLPGGDVRVVMRMAEEGADPQIFTTDDPPRIAVDFADTTNGAERSLSLNTGSTKGITTVEAAGRTRVVIDLYRSSSYSAEFEGKDLVLKISNGLAGQVSSRHPQDPLKAAATAQTRELVKVDFRRGTAGEGRVMLQFSEPGASADLRTEGNKLIIDLPNAAVAKGVQERLDVVDFATPVQAIEIRSRAGSASLTVLTAGEFDQLAYQAGNEYVLEIAPKQVVKEQTRRPDEPPVYSGNRVTFNFQDIPVRSVLQLIADVSELNIVVADSVQGNVTLRLVNVPWDQALDIILQAKGLDKRKNGTVMWIAPTSEIAEREQALEDARIALDERAELVNEFIPINYGNAKDIAELLTADALKSRGGGGGDSEGTQSGFLSSRGSVTFDERTNTLLLNDTPKIVGQIRELVALLDRPVQQVLIESRIVVATDDFAKELGVRFGLTGAEEDSDQNLVSIGGSLAATDRMSNLGLANRLAGRSTALPVGIPSLPPGGIAVPSLSDRLAVNLPVLDPAGSFGFTVLGADYLLDLELSALQTEGRGEIISSPRVITASQREAVIRQGNELPFTVSTIDAQTGAVTQNVQFKVVVLELKVTPTISPDQRIFLNLEVTQDSVAEFAVQGQPAINTRNITTAVLVDNGQTVVLGGILERERREDERKVPFLGDIPAIGRLFKNKSRTDQKDELLIFVTPKILQESLR